MEVQVLDVLLLSAEKDHISCSEFRNNLLHDVMKEFPNFLVLSINEKYFTEFYQRNSQLKCGFVFLFLTKSFLNDFWPILSNVDAIRRHITSGSLIPVFTTKRSKTDFQIPIEISTLGRLQFGDQEVYYKKRVRDLLLCKR
jgi:hypothetical protein